MVNVKLIKSLVPILFLFTGIGFGRSVSLSAEDVFDAYKSAMKQSLLRRGKVAFKSKATQTTKIPARYNVPAKVLVGKWSVFRDSVRMHSRRETYEYEHGQLKPKNKIREYLLENDHGYAITHGVTPLYVFTKDRVGGAFNNLSVVERAFEGYILGDTLKLFWDYLEDNTVALKLRENVEIIDGHETYVLEFKTANLGHFTLWIDYNGGYNLRRFVTRKTGTDLVRGQPLNTPPRPPDGDVPLIHSLPITELTSTLDSVRIENIDGHFIPVEGRITSRSIRSNGEELTIEETVRRSEIDLNPDFDKYENAFVLDVPDGTHVYYRNLGRGIPYVWRKDKVMADVDDLVIAELDKTAQQILADGDVPPKLGSFKKTDTNDKEPNTVTDTNAEAAETQPQVMAQSQGLLVVALILIGFAIVGIAGLLVFRKVKA
jgi:hypothetical protein